MFSPKACAVHAYLSVGLCVVTTRGLVEGEVQNRVLQAGRCVQTQLPALPRSPKLSRCELQLSGLTYFKKMVVSATWRCCHDNIGGATLSTWKRAWDTHST